MGARVLGISALALLLAAPAPAPRGRQAGRPRPVLRTGDVPIGSLGQPLGTW